MKRLFALILTLIFFAATVSIQAADKKDESRIKVKKVFLKHHKNSLITSITGVTYFEEGFEGAFPPDGWSNLGSEAFWQQTDAKANSGSYSAYHNDDNISAVEYDSLITPPIDITSATAPTLDFWQFNNYGEWGEYHGVLISTDDGATWTEIYTGFSSASWEEQVIDLSSYVGHSIKLAFVYGGDWSDEWYIDDIKVLEAPSVPVLSLNYDSVDFGIQEVGDTVTSGNVFIISNTGSGTLTFSNVSGFENSPFSTNFDTSIELDAGIADTFAINFAPISAGDFSAYLIFESNGGTDTIYATGSAYDASNMYVESFEGGFPPDNWTANAIDGSYNWEQYELSWAQEGNYVAKYNSYNASSGSSAELITPYLDLSLNTNDWFGFYYAHPTSSFTDWLDVFVTTGTGWIKVDSILVQDYNWHFYRYNIADFISDSNSKSFRVKFVANSKYGTNQYLDKIILPPIYVSTDEVDWCNLQWPPSLDITYGDSIDVYSQVYVAGLTEGAGQGAGIEAWLGYSDSASDPATWDSDNWVPAIYNEFGPTGNNDEYMFKGSLDLPPGTYYYAFRYSYNGGPFTYGGYSSGGGGFWDGTTNVCGVLTINPVLITNFPYTEGFESIKFPPIGWENPGGYWNQGTESHSGNFCARISYSHSNEAILSSPEVILPDSNIRISFWWKDDDISTNSTNIALIEGHDTTFFEVSSDNIHWLTLDTLSSASKDTAYQFVEENITTFANGSFWFRWRDVTDGLYSACGTGVDDITIEVFQSGPGVPSNPYPIDGANNVDVHDTLSWTNPASTFFNKVYLSSEYEDVLTMNNSALVFDGEVDTTVYSLLPAPAEGFPYSTKIYWKVVEYDASSNTSEGQIWSFTTAANAHPTPFNFDAHDGIGAITMEWEFVPPTEPGTFYEGFERGKIPSNWNNVDQDNDGIYWGVWNLFANTGNYSACSFSYNNTVGVLTPDNWLISPAISLGDSSELTFYMGASDPSYYQEHFEVRLSTLGQNPEDFTNLLLDATLDTASAGKFAKYSIDLSPFANQIVYLAWVHNNSSDHYNISIDDIKVSNTADTKNVKFTFEDKGQIKQFKMAHTSNLFPPLKRLKNEQTDSFKKRINEFILNNKHNFKLPSSLSYFNVYRDGNVIGTSDSLSYIDMTIPQLNKEYTYYVTAVYDDGIESKASNTDSAYVSDPNHVIFYDDFESGVFPPHYTIVNANGDDYTWEVYHGYAQSGEYSMSIRWNANLAMDDWAYIGPINMYQAEDYRLSFGFRAGLALFPENMAVYVTDSTKTVIDTLFDSTNIKNTKYEIFNSVFNVPQNGQYYIAFYGYSKANEFRLCVDDIVLVGNGNIVGVNDKLSIPKKFEMRQNYPNPFNPTTKIEYALPKNEFVTLKIYNSLGQEVKTLINRNVSAGYHTINFNASNLASGIYIYRIKAGNFVSVKKMMLLK